MRETPISLVCFRDCLYRAPISYEEGKVWCAKKGQYLEPALVCAEYRERNETPGSLPVKINQKEVSKMPHYINGSEAKVGDVLKSGDGKIGTIVSIAPGCTTCNARIAVPKVSTPETVYYQADVKVIQDTDGLRFVGLEIINVTLGECEKVA